MKTLLATSTCMLAASMVAGCASAPEVRFPTGNAARVAVGPLQPMEAPTDSRIEALQQSIRALKENVEQLQDEVRKREARPLAPAATPTTKAKPVATRQPVEGTVDLATDALFGFGQSGIQKDTQRPQAALDALAASVMVPTRPVETLIVTGHTDRIGPNELNKRLSLLRAKSVRSYLFDAGVRVPIQVSGAGEADPLVKCEGETGAALVSCLAPNRRVTVSIVHKVA